MKGHHSGVVEHVVFLWGKSVAGLEPNKSGITRWLSSFPVPLVLVQDDCSPAPDAKVLAHELGHVLLHSHARSLHYVAGHSTDDRDLMFPTVHADPFERPHDPRRSGCNESLSRLRSLWREARACARDPVSEARRVRANIRGRRDGAGQVLCHDSATKHRRAALLGTKRRPVDVGTEKRPSASCEPLSRRPRHRGTRPFRRRVRPAYASAPTVPAPPGRRARPGERGRLGDGGWADDRAPVTVRWVPAASC